MNINNWNIFIYYESIKNVLITILLNNIHYHISFWKIMTYNTVFLLSLSNQHKTSLKSMLTLKGVPVVHIPENKNFLKDDCAKNWHWKSPLAVRIRVWWLSQFCVREHFCLWSDWNHFCMDYAQINTFFVHSFTLNRNHFLSGRVL